MSWLDDLIAQIAQNGSDAVPSEPATDATFNQAQDSQSANSLFGALFDGGNPQTSDTAPAQYDQQPPTGSSAADYRNGADLMSDSGKGFAPAGGSSSIIQALSSKAGLKRDSSGSIDWTDPKTLDSIMKLVLGGGALMQAITHHNNPQGYKTAAQLQAEIKNPLFNWNPTQQASANAFFNTPINNGPTRARLYAADMPSPIVPGKGYADGGTVVQWSSDHSPSAPAYGYAPGAQGAQTMQAPQMFGSLHNLNAGSSGSSASGAASLPGTAANAQPPASGAPPTSNQLNDMYTGFPRTMDYSGFDPTTGHYTTVQDAQYRQGSQYPNGYAFLDAQGSPINLVDRLVNTPSGDPSPQPWNTAGAQQIPFDYNAYLASVAANPLREMSTAALNQALSTGMINSADTGFTHDKSGNLLYARGGPVARTPYGALGHVMSDGGGQDDTVDAKLSGGEYVMDADTVSAVGDGNNAAGAKKLDGWREELRRQKRAAPAGKIPPKTRELSSYMKGGR